MRIHVLFVAALALIFGGFAYFAFAVVQSPFGALRGPHDSLDAFVRSYQETHPARVQLDLSTLYSHSSLYEVLHPSLDLRLFRSEQAPSCDGDYSPARAVPVDEIQRAKGASLNLYLLGLEPLPSDFFQTYPIIDENGASYAYRLLQQGPTALRTSSWVERHLPYFTISELAELLPHYVIDAPPFALISHLSNENRNDLLTENPLILTESFLLVRDTSPYVYGHLRYRAYDRHDLQEELRREGRYELAPFEAGSACLERSGSVCWTYDSTRLITGLRRNSLLILAATALIFFAFVALYARYLFEKSREERKHRLALQVLSHEFRTPVASLLLLLERLRETSADTELVARAGGEIHRLQRIVEVSRAYLQTTGRHLHFQSTQIESVNEWVADVLGESGFNVQFEPLGRDRSISTDAFWLRFVLLNLVQNALVHGRAPVLVRVREDARRIWLEVEDRGHCEFTTLREMTHPFVKGPSSRGLGLGLNIVSFIAQEWKRDLRFGTAPTTFSFALDDAHS